MSLHPILFGQYDSIQSYSASGELASFPVLLHLDETEDRGPLRRDAGVASAVTPSIMQRPPSTQRRLAALRARRTTRHRRPGSWEGQRGKRRALWHYALKFAIILISWIWRDTFIANTSRGSLAPSPSLILYTDFGRIIAYMYCSA